MKKRFNSITGFILTVVMLFSTCSNLKVVNAEDNKNPYKKGDKVYLDGGIFSVEPIKWRILSVSEDGEDAFVIADRGLDWMRYDYQVIKDATWESSTIRKWLNDDFYNIAFSSAEKSAIKKTDVINDDNTVYEVEGGNNTEDYIYLPSMAEVCNPDYGFDTDYKKLDKTRRVVPTDYAVQNNAWFDVNLNSHWWLRTPGMNYASAMYVMYEGDLEKTGCGKECIISVRPVMHINLKSSNISYAGEVDSEGNVSDSDNGYNNPVKDEGTGVVTWDCIYLGNYPQTITGEYEFTKNIEPYKEGDIVEGKYLLKYKVEPIKWRILSLSEDGNSAFVISDNCIDNKQYHKCYPSREYSSVLWEDCTLRAWLNEDFYKSAFDEEERRLITKTTVINKDNEKYGTSGGNNTEDYVYLLSIDDSLNTDYGFDADRTDSNTRLCKPTYYTYGSTYGSGYCYWWLRSPGEDSVYAANVSYKGLVQNGGHRIYHSSFGIRPVLNISLNSDLVKNAGTIDSENNTNSNDDGYNKPVRDAETGVVTWDCIYFGNYPQNRAQPGEINPKPVSTPTVPATPTQNVDPSSTATVVPTAGQAGVVTPSAQSLGASATTPVAAKDNKTSFNIKNKKTIKKTSKIKIKDKDKIKSIILNGKKIKIKSGKTSYVLKLKSYAKKLKKKGKWNTLKVTDKSGNVATIQFKIK